MAGITVTVTATVDAVVVALRYVIEIWQLYVAGVTLVDAMLTVMVPLAVPLVGDRLRSPAGQLDCDVTLAVNDAVPPLLVKVMFCAAGGVPFCVTLEKVSELGLAV